MGLMWGFRELVHWKVFRYYLAHSWSLVIVTWLCKGGASFPHHRRKSWKWLFVLLFWLNSCTCCCLSLPRIRNLRLAFSLLPGSLKLSALMEMFCISTAPSHLRLSSLEMWVLQLRSWGFNLFYSFKCKQSHVACGYCAGQLACKVLKRVVIIGIIIPSWGFLPDVVKTERNMEEIPFSLYDCVTERSACVPPKVFSGTLACLPHSVNGGALDRKFKALVCVLRPALVLSGVLRDCGPVSFFLKWEGLG